MGDPSSSHAEDVPPETEPRVITYIDAMAGQTLETFAHGTIITLDSLSQAFDIEQQLMAVLQRSQPEDIHMPFADSSAPSIAHILRPKNFIGNPINPRMIVVEASEKALSTMSNRIDGTPACDLMLLADIRVGGVGIRGTAVVSRTYGVCATFHARHLKTGDILETRRLVKVVTNDRTRELTPRNWDRVLETNQQVGRLALALALSPHLG